MSAEPPGPSPDADKETLHEFGYAQQLLRVRVGAKGQDAADGGGARDDEVEHDAKGVGVAAHGGQPPRDVVRGREEEDWFFFVAVGLLDYFWFGFHVFFVALSVSFFLFLLLLLFVVYVWLVFFMFKKLF